MALLTYRARFDSLFQDAGKTLVPDGDLDKFIKETRRLTAENLRAVPELKAVESIDRLDVDLTFGYVTDPNNPDPSEKSGYLIVKVAARIDNSAAYGYAEEGSPVNKYLDLQLTTLTKAFQSLPNYGQDLLTAWNGNGQAAPDLTIAVEVEVDAPKPGRPVE